jgi:hypothetical protein
MDGKQMKFIFLIYIFIFFSSCNGSKGSNENNYYPDSAAQTDDLPDDPADYTYTYAELNTKILATKCMTCHSYTHGWMTSEAGVDTQLVPGDPDNSPLFNRLLGIGGSLMPDGGPSLSQADIDYVDNFILNRQP